MKEHSTGRPRLQNRTGHYCARIWGEVERRIAIGGVVYPDGGMVVDGWPPSSPSAQWKEGDGGSHRRHTQKFAEVHNRESLLVARATASMTELERMVLRMVYVEGRGVPKAVWMANTAIGRNKLYEVLHSCMAHIEAEEGRDKSENSPGQVTRE